MRDLAEARYLSPELIEQAARRLDELGKLVNREDLAAALAVEEPASVRTNEPDAGLWPACRNREARMNIMMRSRSSKLAQNAPPAAGAAALGAIDGEPGAASGGLDRHRPCCWRGGCASRRGLFCKGAGSTGT